MSGDLSRRVFEHKEKLIDEFTKKHNLTECLYFEFTEAPWQALIREKQIKNMGRAEKLTLIKTKNPLLIDIYGELFKQCG